MNTIKYSNSPQKEKPPKRQTNALQFQICVYEQYKCYDRRVEQASTIVVIDDKCHNNNNERNISNNTRD